MGKLADALKQKYKTPHAALKALGLDGALLRKEVVGDSMPDALKTPTVKMNLMAYNYGLGLAMAMDAKPSFEEWMKQVDAAVSARAGVSVHDLDDYAFRDAYDRGESPKIVAKKAVKYPGGE